MSQLEPCVWVAELPCKAASIGADPVALAMILALYQAEAAQRVLESAPLQTPDSP